jgi:hypothetical protein
VIKGATSLSAVNNNGAIFLLDRVVAQPPGVDIAILKFRANDVPFLKLGTSATAVEGQKVIVIGNPTGLIGSVSDGIISAFREERSMIQITAPISPGSSGSPVMSEDGQVIGVATLQSMEGQNLNFAIAVRDESLRFSFVVRVCRTSGLILFRRWLEMASSSSLASSATAAWTSPSLFGYMTPFSRKEYDAGWTKSNFYPVTTYQESWNEAFISGTNSCSVLQKIRLQAGG